MEVDLDCESISRLSSDERDWSGAGCAARPVYAWYSRHHCLPVRLEQVDDPHGQVAGLGVPQDDRLVDQGRITSASPRPTSMISDAGEGSYSHPCCEHVVLVNLLFVATGGRSG